MGEAVWTLDGAGLGGARRPRLGAVSLDIPAGTTAVVGASGSGKTSLLNLLVGFEEPTTGNVSFRPPPGEPPLFWVPPDGGLWPHLTAREHLRVVSPDDAPAPDELLARFALDEVRDQRPETLSAGERARLAVARALASGARVLVMDEPLVHVDAARLEDGWDVIRGHVAALGTTLVFATHDPRRVLLEADHVVCLERGRVLGSGAARELYERPATPALAACLGEANWLTNDEARRWITNGVTPAPGGCYRPEQVEVQPAADAALEVASVRNAGPVETIEVRHVASGERRRFWVRPGPGRILPGDRVVLRALLSLLLMLLGACAESAPGLEVRRTRHHAMPPEGTRVPAPRALAVRGEELLVLDNAGRVLVLDETGRRLRHWRMPESERGNPEGLCPLDDGRIVVADTHYHRLVYFDDEGNVLAKVGAHGRGPGQFLYPVKVTQDAAGFLYVAEYGSNDRVQKLTRDGGFVGAFGSFGTEPGQFQRLSGIVWHEGRLWVSDAVNGRIQVFTDQGRFLEALPHPALDFPYDLCRGPLGRLWVVEYGAGRVSVLGADGRLLARWGRRGTGPSELATPWGLIVDGRRLWIADTGNRRLVEVEW